LFSLAESVSGFVSRPYDETMAIGGLIEIATFALPFFVIAWLLWVRPKVGALLLICLGVAMGIWTTLDWRAPRTVDDWVIRAVLVAAPFLLGAFTLIRETLTRRARAGSRA
jgi:thiol:disulfide interchange protein